MASKEFVCPIEKAVNESEPEGEVVAFFQTDNHLVRVSAERIGRRGACGLGTVMVDFRQGEINKGRWSCSRCGMTFGFLAAPIRSPKSETSNAATDDHEVASDPE